MAHFAEIDNTNKVLRVLVVDNAQEERGQEFLANDLGLGGTWVQTSYNANFLLELAIYMTQLMMYLLRQNQRITNE